MRFLTRFVKIADSLPALVDSNQLFRHWGAHATHSAALLLVPTCSPMRRVGLRADALVTMPKVNFSKRRLRALGAWQYATRSSEYCSCENRRSAANRAFAVVVVVDSLLSTPRSPGGERTMSVQRVLETAARATPILRHYLKKDPV